MPLVENVEKKIESVEHFRVAILHADGRNMRGDKTGIPMYSFERVASDMITVAEWKKNRFKPIYIGFDVEILFANGKAATGNTLLSSVRATYIKE